MLQPKCSPEALPSTFLHTHTSKEKLNERPELLLSGDLTHATLMLRWMLARWKPVACYSYTNSATGPCAALAPHVIPATLHYSYPPADFFFLLKRHWFPEFHLAYHLCQKTTSRNRTVSQCPAVTRNPVFPFPSVSQLITIYRSMHLGS